MNKQVLSHAALILLGTFLSSISQVMLKKAAQKDWGSVLREYLNPLVIVSYLIFFGTTLLSVLAYRAIPLSMGPVLEATSYIWVTIFGVRIFGEHVDRQKLLALAVILLGICIYAMGT